MGLGHDEDDYDNGHGLDAQGRCITLIVGLDLMLYMKMYATVGVLTRVQPPPVEHPPGPLHVLRTPLFEI
jgi:hypothetical protein